MDFVDIELTEDNRLYVDPFAIQIKEDTWSTDCGDLVRSFFSAVLEALRERNDARAHELLSHLHEPNETYLGQSEGRPAGRGVGDDKATWLATAIRNSRAFETGILSDISEAALYIRYVGPDTISDLTTNILREKLAEYTSQQCELHGVETTPVGALPPAWDANRQRWRGHTYHLPLHAGRPILLVPKYSVRQRMSLDSQEFYNHHMLTVLQAEHLRAGDALVEVLKNGTRRVTKASLKIEHPFIKDDLAEFVRDHPEVMDAYKEIKGAKGPPQDDDLQAGFDERAFANALAASLPKIPPGRPAADRYHEFMIGVLTFLFYPDLICPIKEQPLHGGRKRIDIKYTNAGTTGFFDRALRSAQMRAISVVVECKNYSEEIANEELDQLAGRFGNARGFLGLSISRTAENRDRLIQRCRDAALDGRGYLIPLLDEDILAMLDAVVQGQRPRIETRLQAILDAISH